MSSDDWFGTALSVSIVSNQGLDGRNLITMIDNTNNNIACIQGCQLIIMTHYVVVGQYMQDMVALNYMTYSLD